MSARNVFEIFRRTVNGRASLGIVTDDFLAKQVVAALYDALRKTVLTPAGEMQLEAAGFDPNVFSDARDWDTWATNNRNSPTPVFFYAKKTMWNAVPSNLNDWVLSEDPEQFSAASGEPDRVITALGAQTE